MGQSYSNLPIEIYWTIFDQFTYLQFSFSIKVYWLLTIYHSFNLQARAIIKAEPPFAIMHINEPWTALSGLSQAEAEGRPLSDSLRLHSSQVRFWSCNYAHACNHVELLAPVAPCQLFFNLFVFSSQHKHLTALLLIFLQEEQMYALAADCSIGSAGSAILMTHSRSAQGEPALIYLKVRRVRMICIRGY